MIFITTGTQEPFDRLLKTMDEIAGNLNEKVIVQALKGDYVVKNMEFIEFLDPKEFKDIFEKSRLIVSHAGMGTIISALTAEKPIVVMPRKAQLNEHRNDHQMATASKFNKLGYVIVAQDEVGLKEIVSEMLIRNELKPLYKLEKYASCHLIDSIKEFIKL